MWPYILELLIVFVILIKTVGEQAVQNCGSLPLSVAVVDMSCSKNTEKLFECIYN